MLNTTWKLSLAVLTAITIGLTATAAQAQLLQEYWDFEDGNIGGTNTSIGLKNGTAATPEAGTTATYADPSNSPLPGNSVAAAFLDGVDEQDRFRVSDITFLDGVSSFSLSAWIKPTKIDTADGDRNMWVTNDQSFEWGTQGDGTDAVFLLRINNNDRHLGDMPVQNSLLDNQWHHVAVTYNGAGNVDYYLDGNPWWTNPVVATEATVDAVPEVFGFGNRPDDPGGAPDLDQGYVGQLDEVAIFTSLLTAGQISDLANGDVTPLNVPEPSSFLLAGLGVVGLALLGRRRRLRGK